ncbi:MAG TPA: hypothetical protein O0W79_04865 [Methanocorpusculum sp.]|nr:hypothetical protein [Methanocorpusculum sp.]
MTDTNQPVEKAGLSVFALVMTILGLLGFAAYIVCYWMKLIEVPYIYLVILVALIFVVIGILVAKSLNKKGRGIQKINTTVINLTWVLLILVIIEVILGFVVPTSV